MERSRWINTISSFSAPICEELNNALNCVRERVVLNFLNLNPSKSQPNRIRLKNLGIYSGAVLCSETQMFMMTSRFLADQIPAKNVALHFTRIPHICIWVLMAHVCLRPNYGNAILLGFLRNFIEDSIKCKMPSDYCPGADAGTILPPSLGRSTGYR